MSKNPKMIICRNCNTAITKKAKICPSCGAKNKKPFYKKAWFIILSIIVVIGVIGSIGGDNGGSSKDNEVDKTEEYKWPDSDIGRMIPLPDSSYGKVSYESEDSFWIDIYDISDEQFENYIDECKNCGFTVDYNKFDGYYSAEDEKGYSLSLTYNKEKETLSISMNAPAEEAESQDNADVEDTEEASSEETTPSTEDEQNAAESTDNDSQELVDGMRPEFKEAMDSYEAFYDEYCDFMKKYTENPTDLELIAEYADMVSELAEMDKKFQAWDEDEMNDAEAKYYLEVSARVAKKLLEIAE